MTYTVRAASAVQPSNPLRHLVIPVYRLGLSGSGGSGGGSSSSVLSVRWATSDGSAVGVSARKGAECQGLPPAARGAAGCGDYVASAGELTFGAGVGRMDIQVVIMGSAGGEGRTFAVELFSPGGSRVQGEKATVVIV